MAKIVPPMNFGLVEDGEFPFVVRSADNSRLLPLGAADRAQLLLPREAQPAHRDLGRC